MTQSDTGPVPKLSIVVIVYDMVQQAMNTLFSLSTAYQQGVSADDYEVIVVENRSARVLDTAAVEALPGRFRHILRDETGISPAPAINFGLSLARAPVVGLMIDGARMLTPGVIGGALAAYRVDPRALVAVPGYQLGAVPHHLAKGRTREMDAALLSRIAWKRNGYRLFDISSLGLANRMGIFRPFMECNCLFAPADAVASIGGADGRFNLSGGGALNLYIWYRLAHFPGLNCVVLPGEGSFHQVHGGVTTTSDEDYRANADAFLDQLNAILGEPFKSPDVPVTYLGKLPQELNPFLVYSMERFKRKPPNTEAAIDRKLGDGPTLSSPLVSARPPPPASGPRPRDLMKMPFGPLAEDTRDSSAPITPDP